LRKLEAREKAAALPAKLTAVPDVTARTSRSTRNSRPALPSPVTRCAWAWRAAIRLEAKELAKENYGDDSAMLVKMIDLAAEGRDRRGERPDGRVGVGTRPLQRDGRFHRLPSSADHPRQVRDDGEWDDVSRSPAVPFNTRVSGFSSGTSAAWVGEGLPVLLSKATSFTTSLTWSKLGALAVLTKEEIRFSNPSAEAKVRDDLVAALVQKMDIDFLNPARAAVANVNPSSITYQTTPVLTTGTTAAAFRTDFATLIGTFATALLSPEDIVIIMSTVDALNLSLMITSLGNQVFPGMTMAGGYLMGFPVITTTAMVSTGSPSSTIIVAVKAGEIYLADDGEVTVDASDQASVEMVDSSSQTGIVGTGASVVSLLADQLVGLKATRAVNWKLRRTGAARYIYNAAYRA
jgi:hypothetical protein